MKGSGKRLKQTVRNAGSRPEPKWPADEERSDQPRSMFITIIFVAFLLLSMTISLVDWRRGWLVAIVCGVLQDPARKLTAGTPVVMSLSIVLVYVVVLFAAQKELQERARAFASQFGNLYASLMLVFIFPA